MSTETLLLAALLVIALGATHHAIHGLPARLHALMKRERTDVERADADVLAEAVTARAAAALLAITSYEEQLRQLVRAEVAAAEMRARVAERRLSDSSPPLAAASTLVAQLRAIADDLLADLHLPPGARAKLLEAGASPPDPALRTAAAEVRALLDQGMALDDVLEQLRGALSPTNGPTEDDGDRAPTLPPERATMAEGPRALASSSVQLRATVASDAPDEDEELTQVGPRAGVMALVAQGRAAAGGAS